MMDEVWRITTRFVIKAFMPYPDKALIIKALSLTNKLRLYHAESLVNACVISHGLLHLVDPIYYK